MSKKDVISFQSSTPSKERVPTLSGRCLAVTTSQSATMAASVAETSHPAISAPTKRRESERIREAASPSSRKNTVATSTEDAPGNRIAPTTPQMMSTTHTASTATPTPLGSGPRWKRNCTAAIPASSTTTRRAGISSPLGRYRAVVARIGSRKAATTASGLTHVLAWLGTRQV